MSCGGHTRYCGYTSVVVVAGDRVRTLLERLLRAQPRGRSEGLSRRGSAGPLSLVYGRGHATAPMPRARTGMCVGEGGERTLCVVKACERAARGETGVCVSGATRALAHVGARSAGWHDRRERTQFGAVTGKEDKKKKGGQGRNFRCFVDSSLSFARLRDWCLPVFGRKCLGSGFVVQQGLHPRGARTLQRVSRGEGGKSSASQPTATCDAG